MRIFLCKTPNSPTIDFALNELVRYLRQIDPKMFVDQATVSSYSEKTEKMLYVGLLSSETTADDKVNISISNGTGYISGSNERSVLFAVYKFLEHLGCRWFRPGDDGEFIPQKSLTLEDMNFAYEHIPSYRHRGVCLEGCVNYQIVFNVINWLPKMGMNEYFIQFHNPWTFFNYYSAVDPEYKFTQEETALITKRIEEEIALRGIGYHKVGHGWTYPLVGKEGYGWCEYKEEVPEDVKALFAEIDGKRDLWQNNLFNTNLCYSNPEARDRMTDGIVEYCKKNPQVKYLHFWLADAVNNHCECAECRKMRPSDYYVLMLNELDEKLTREGIDTKIVFLLYLDLTFPPEHYKFNNPDRFTLMLAPGRCYTKTLVEIANEKEPEPVEYVRNKVVSFRYNPSALFAFLKEWKQVFPGDSFVFDYHMMWNHQIDAGTYRNARVLHDDMKNLDYFDIDGMISCQLQRVYTPVNLSMFGMGRALWDKTSKFEDVSREYFEGSFHRDGDKVAKYLETLSALFDSDSEDKHDKIVAEIEAKLPLFEKNLAEAIPGSSTEMSWKYLVYHGKFTKLAHTALSLFAKDDPAAGEARQRCRDYVLSVDPEIRNGMDTYEYYHITTMRGDSVGFWRKPGNEQPAPVNQPKEKEEP